MQDLWKKIHISLYIHHFPHGLFIKMKKEARFVEKDSYITSDVAFPSWVIQETEERCKICGNRFIFH
ncbi:hypothetical protein Hanom_Chr03g00247271 [Helianthus anomalus]